MEPPPKTASSSPNNEKEGVAFGPERPPPPLPVALGSSPPTPDVFHMGRNHGVSTSLIASSTLRHVQRVSKQAALATKKTIWDSNDASIVAAQSAVDQWEQGYNALRGLLMAMGHSAQGLYGAAKAGATGLEHGFLTPIRDWVLLPAFGGVERLAGDTVGFFQSEQAEQFAHHSLSLTRQVPFVGENILAPALCIGAEVLKKTWEIAQYPIPSPHQVRESVDYVMTGTKYALTTAGREIFFYIKRADANITRTLSHTQWKVLGSGPYATLDKLNKREVIDHLCERYFSLVDAVARYELAAHIRAHNRPLYHDLVLTGLLRERGGDLTLDDEWLSSCPSYRSLESPFLLPDHNHDSSTGIENNDEWSDAFSVWFRLPYHNGKRPGSDTPWVRFEKSERIKLESHYRSMLSKHKDNTATPSRGFEKFSSLCADYEGDPQKYATNAKWYEPDLDQDLLLDQKRHTVSFFPCCPKCRKRHTVTQPPRLPKQFGELCDECTERDPDDAPWVDALLSPPPLVALYRPTMWRYYGPGDELRRATWFLDTQRHGLQPYCEDAQAVLEDAYLFLKWMAQRRVWDGSILLTVQVPSPDGSEQLLVQFSSLTSATAIGKGLGAAIALFKRRVYRGMHQPLNEPKLVEMEDKPSSDSSIDNESDDKLSDLPFLGRPSDQSDGASRDLEKRLSLDIDVQEEDVASAEDFQDANMEYEISDQDNHDTNCPDSMKEQEELSHTVKSQDETDQNLNTDNPEEMEAKLVEPICTPVSLAFNLMELPPADSEITQEKGEGDDGSDNVDHLILVVHGVGEMLQSIDLFGLSKLPSLMDCCGFLRRNHAEVLNVRFNQLYQTLDGTSQPRKGRVEYLPVEWHESFTIQSQRRLLAHSHNNSAESRFSNFSIDDISLRTIPQLRQFANDTLMDVLYFMSPEHHDIIIDIVVNEMNLVVEKFRAFTGFTGDVSVIGHSLGSIIAWDILDHQRIIKEPVGCSKRKSATDDNEEDCVDGSQVVGFRNNSPKGENHPNPEETEPAEAPSNGYPQLSFNVDNAFMLGSPIPVFLMIRNQREPLNPNFTLQGCARVFNIFHPYDPVAYRIEPLLDPRNADYEPKIMTHWHGGFRFQYQTKRLWRHIVQQTHKTQENVIEKLESGIAALGLLDGAHDMDREEEDVAESNISAHKIVTGSLNRGQRIDYMLQEKEIENAGEYVAALAAHSSYWLEKDLSLFVARQICLRALERETGDETPFLKQNSFHSN